jgi:hypothetical protein
MALEATAFLEQGFGGAGVNFSSSGSADRNDHAGGSNKQISDDHLNFLRVISKEAIDQVSDWLLVERCALSENLFLCAAHNPGFLKQAIQTIW